MNQSIRELFEAAISLPEQDRAAFIDAQFADPGSSDTELRARLRRMLEVDKCAADIGDAAALSDAIGETRPMQHEIGSRIGPFTIEARIGDGGSSVIYRASREIAGTRQVVALKILRRGMYAPEARRMFDRERNALAALQHPFIAQFIDGGVESSGQAYLALELVDGVPITEYARSKTLDFRTRLKLFEQVARAVAAAHRSLIVHRDLKPANVMITKDGHVKLLDFGIAKILSDELDLTRTEFQAFTPAYAAPEQRDGGPITTATDVYSLGILLGELLTGHRVNDGNSHTPSARITEDTSQGVLPATPQQTRKLLRGDLDNIVLKALEAEPERRYASAAEFADDIGRLLDGQPVTAHPPSVWYRASKFVRRHGISVAVVSLLIIALIATTGVALWQAEHARHNEAAAISEATRAKASRDLLIDVFKTAKADAPRAEKPSPESLVRAAIAKVENNTAMDDELRRDLTGMLGEVSLSMGSYPIAERLLDEANALALKLHLSNENTLVVEVRRADVLQRTDRVVQADQMLEALLPRFRAARSAAAVEGLALLSTTRFGLGKADDAIRFGDEMAAIAMQVYERDSKEALMAASWPGQLAAVVGRNEDAVQRLAPIVQRWRTQNFGVDENFAQVLSNLATANKQLGNDVAAEALYREAIAAKRLIFQGPHDELASALERFGVFLAQRERVQEAEQFLQEGLAMNRATLGENSISTAENLDSLGRLAHTRLDPAGAEKYFRAALSIYLSHAEDAPADLLATSVSLAGVLIETQHFAEAEQLLARANISAVALPQDDKNRVAIEVLTARLALARGDATTALSVLERAMQQTTLVRPGTLADMHFLKARCEQSLGHADAAYAAASTASDILRTQEVHAKSRRTAILLWQARSNTARGQPQANAPLAEEITALGVDRALLLPEDLRTWEGLTGPVTPAKR